MVPSQNLEKEVARLGCRWPNSNNPGILKKSQVTSSPNSRSVSFQVEEEKTSHFVQLDDGTFAEMVEGHEMVAPGRKTSSRVGIRGLQIATRSPNVG